MFPIEIKVVNVSKRVKRGETVLWSECSVSFQSVLTCLSSSVKSIAIKRKMGHLLKAELKLKYFCLVYEQ